MTPPEFAIWLINHKAAFPSLSPWLAKLDNATDVLGKWQYFLRDVDFFTAKRATDKLALNEGRTYYESHPRFVVNFCKQQSESTESAKTFSRFGGQVTHLCPICHDTGQVSVYVYGNQLPRYIESYGPEATITKACCVNCNCQIGISRGGPVLDTGSMIPETRLIERKQEVLDLRIKQIDDALQGMMIGCDKLPRPQFPPSAKIVSKFAFWGE